MPTFRKRAYKEQDHDKVETLKVIRPARFKDIDTNEVKPFAAGAEIKLSGTTKKAAYFDDVVCYPEEFDACIEAIKKKYKIENSTSTNPDSMNALTGKEAEAKKNTKKNNPA